MTILTDPPRESFRLSMLIYDSRYRSATIQIVALIGVLLAVGWLVSNAFSNLETLGKPVQFSFLSEPASYDINQKLIDYDSRDSHFRAAIVGLLNTLLVAFLGCIAATFVGVAVGVLRLSDNWLISRLMAVYVEGLRNVPVLLWIVLTMAILIETLPTPVTFRGDEATSSMLFGLIAVSNQGIFIPRMVFASYGWLMIVVLILSVIATKVLGRRADGIQEKTGERPATLIWSIGLIVVPVVITYLAISQFTTRTDQSFIAVGVENVETLQAYSDEKGRITYCHASDSAGSLIGLRVITDAELNMRRKNYFNAVAAQEALGEGKCDVLAISTSQAAETATLVQSNLKEGTPIAVIAGGFVEGSAFEVDVPSMSDKGIPRFEGGTRLRNSLIALWLALTLYTSAFIAEIVRAGILAVSHGQTEAAAALGIRSSKIMSLVVLPQAMRVIVPPLISQYLNLTKNSSLAIAVGYMDITGTLMGITMNQTGRELEAVLLTMVIYLSISLTISTGMNWYNERTKMAER